MGSRGRDRAGALCRCAAGLAIAGALLSACDAADASTAGAGAGAGAQEAASGVEGFHFLPPLASAAAYGAFQGGLSPIVTVRELDSGATIASWSTAGGTDGTRVREEDRAYTVVWQTGRAGLVAGRKYRIEVGLEGETVALGAMDLTASASGTGALVVGRDLTIQFRVDASAVYCLDAPACARFCVTGRSPGGVWRPRAALPTDAVLTAPYYVGAAAVDGVLYTAALQRLAIGGGNTFQKIAAYDPARNAWSMPAGDADYVGEGNWGFALVGLAPDLYRLAGFQDHGASSTVLIYDTGTATWRHGPWLTGAYEFPAAALFEGRIYVMGGDSFSGYSADVQSYAPGDAAWRPETPLPEPAAYLGATAAAGRVYALGGSGGSALWAYDPVALQWTAAAAIPTPRTRLAAVTFAGKVHAIGGWSDAEGGWSRAHEVYDPASGTWSARAPLLPPGTGSGPLDSLLETYAATIGCHVYAIVGGVLQEYTAPRP